MAFPTNFQIHFKNFEKNCATVKMAEINKKGGN
jgi:hypothetical protein